MMLKKNEASLYLSTQNGQSSDSIPPTSITVYGGKKEEVSDSAKRLLGIKDDDYYSTWLNLGIMRRLGFLFDGGIESAGGIVEILCVLALIVIILAMFALWNVFVIFLVVAVLTLLSGGGALKFVRAVYITVPLSQLDKNQINEFVAEQVSLGRFVRIEDAKASKEMSALTKKISAATLVFRTGIRFAILIATIFLITEVIYYFVMNRWITGLYEATRLLEVQIMTYFGLLFLFGVILMDVGILLRIRAARRLKV